MYPLKVVESEAEFALGLEAVTKVVEHGCGLERVLAVLGIVQLERARLQLNGLVILALLTPKRGNNSQLEREKKRRGKETKREERERAPMLIAAFLSFFG